MMNKIKKNMKVRTLCSPGFPKTVNIFKCCDEQFDCYSGKENQKKNIVAKYYLTGYSGYSLANTEVLK